MIGTSYLPLDQPRRWLRGNHHNHSTVSDGEDDPLTNVRVYEEAGYDYLAFSEHDTLLNPGDLLSRTTMFLLPAVEVTTVRGQTMMVLGAIGPAPLKATLTAGDVMAQARAAGALFIVDHPNWVYRPDRIHITDDELDDLHGLQGIEIYTGVIERLAGSALATDRWDRLLSQGRRVFGHATDDQHGARDRFIAWNQVQWPESQPITATGIIEALAGGRFYASTGVTIERIGVTEAADAIVIESDADEIHWVADGGVVVAKSRKGSTTFRVADAALRKLSYLRAQCFGRGGAMAWTQPFWFMGAPTT